MTNLAHKNRWNRIVISMVALAAMLLLPIVNVPAALSAPLAITVTIPNKVGFEGYLTDGTGQPISDGAHNLAFRVYSAVSDPPVSALWVETQSITVTTGLYSALLGSSQALTSNLFNGDRWIGVTVDGGTEIAPRTQVASVPFALNAEHANSAESAAAVPWSGVTGAPSFLTGSAANGQVAVWGPSNTLAGTAGLLSANNTLTVTNGLNVGTASGATGGQIRASGTVTGSNLSGTNSGDATLAGENYLSLSGQAFTANAVNLSGSNVTGLLAAARFPALTGDVSTSGGSLATTIGSNKVGNTQLAQMATKTLKGNNSVSTANAADLTVAQVNTMLGTVTGSGANTQLAYFNGTSTATSSANLTTDGTSLTVGGGVNTGAATGAGTGDVAHAGGLKSYKNSTLYAGYAMTLLGANILGNVNMDGNDTIAVGTYTVDIDSTTALSGSTYGYSGPSNVAVALVRVQATWAAAASASVFRLMDLTNVAAYGVLRAHDTMIQDGYFLVPVDITTGQFKFVIVNAQATNVTLQIIGYGL